MNLKRMMCLLLSVVIICGLFAGCQRPSAESTNPSEPEVELPVADVEDETAAPEEEEVVEEVEEPITLDALFPVLPESVIIEGNALYDTTESKIMAELIAVESLPFSHYDELYAEAVRIEEGSWGEYQGKWYWLQEEITDGAVSGFKNTLVYCIQVGDEMVVINFYPVQGVGGIGPQREAFEEILNTIN